MNQMIFDFEPSRYTACHVMACPFGAHSFNAEGKWSNATAVSGGFAVACMLTESITGYGRKSK